MRLIGYVRVSTDDQAREGVSLAAQEHAIRSWCEAMGHELVAMYSDDGASAKSLDRPWLRTALNDVLHGAEANMSMVADGLVVVKLDRLTRSVRDFCELVERFDRAGKALVSVRDSLDTSTASGRLVANILASVAQWEREAISERTKEALAQKRREGVRLGRPPMPVSTTTTMSMRVYRERGSSYAEIAADHGVSIAVVRRVLGAPR